MFEISRAQSSNGTAKNKDYRHWDDFTKLANNRQPLEARSVCCFFSRRPYASMVVHAKNRLRRELDLVRFLKKQRTTTNLLWGLTSPWQRAMSRQQSKILLRDKAESEFQMLKLISIKRSREPDQWNSSSSADPTSEKIDPQVKANPTSLDRKFMKRYIEFCTPAELKLPLARQRMLNRVFGGGDDQEGIDSGS